ncbi:hypothetical protein AB9P05_15035 [Roseivirga sp. BDSF3-8]|uniref:hypothetical protein n=1 Tax=Roseivirga sp. BDSF3-8 TaxID=3241598 RepID=UPI003531D465
MEFYPLAILILLTMCLLVVLLYAVIYSHRQSSLDLQDIKTEIQLMYLQKLTAETEIMLKYERRPDAGATLHKNIEKFCKDVLSHKKRWKEKPGRIPAIHNAIDRADRMLLEKPNSGKGIIIGAMVEESLREFRKSSVYANLLDHCQSHPSLYQSGLVAGVTELISAQYPDLQSTVTIAGNDEKRRFSPYLEMMLFDTCIMLIMSGTKEPGVNEVTIFIDAMQHHLELTFQTRRDTHNSDPDTRSAIALATHSAVKNHLQLINGEIIYNPSYSKGTMLQISLPVAEESRHYLSV